MHSTSLPYGPKSDWLIRWLRLAKDGIWAPEPLWTFEPMLWLGTISKRSADRKSVPPTALLLLWLHLWFFNKCTTRTQQLHTLLHVITYSCIQLQCPRCGHSCAVPGLHGCSQGWTSRFPCSQHCPARWYRCPDQTPKCSSPHEGSQAAGTPHVQQSRSSHRHRGCPTVHCTTSPHDL